MYRNNHGEDYYVEEDGDDISMGGPEGAIAPLLVSIPISPHSLTTTSKGEITFLQLCIVYQYTPFPHFFPFAFAFSFHWYTQFVFSLSHCSYNHYFLLLIFHSVFLLLFFHWLCSMVCSMVCSIGMFNWYVLWHVQLLCCSTMVRHL